MKINIVCTTPKHGNFAGKYLVKSLPLPGLGKARGHLIGR